MRVLIVCPDRDPVGGVRQHCLRLAEQLAAQGVAALVVNPAEALVKGEADVVHLHYVPFAFGLYGLAAVPLARRLQRIGRLVVTFHEVRTTFRMSPREAALAPLQAIPATILNLAAREVIVPTRRWESFFPAGRATYIPAGSSLLPDVQPVHRNGQRARLRVGMIYSGHSGRAAGLAAEGCRLLASEIGAAPRCIGGSVPGFEGTKRLDIAAFGAELNACDIMLLPYADGVTGRRTSFMSALQVGLPVVTTTLPDQSDFETTSAFAASDARRPDDFLQLCLDSATDQKRRMQMAAHGRALFAASLDWAVLGGRHMDVYERAAA
jgi:glycosyltransferase involved in cell wall biosynthesis